MLKTGGKDSAFGEAAQQQASAALASAADDLVVRHAEMARMAAGPGAGPSTVFMKGGEGGRLGNEEKVADDDHDDADDDDDDDPELRELRIRRMQQLRNSIAERQVKMTRGHGEYRYIEESEFLKEVTTAEHVVCHFHHRDFERCKIIDKHLRIITTKHPDTKFITIDAEKARFFVAKLAVRVLPTIIIFNDGVAVDQIVGFEELGNKDDFQTVVLVKRLIKSGAISLEGDGGEQRRPHRAQRVKTLL